MIIISGPTASGKTDIAIKIAEKFNKSIISADSRQVYNFLNIGTAKPSPDILEKYKHYLIDIINPDEQYNAGRFFFDVQKILKKENKNIPIIVGGTGLYIKAFLEGLAPIPDIPDDIVNNLKKKLEKQGLLSLYESLKRIDPECAEFVHHNDKQRIIRFLSIFEHTGKTFSEWKKEQKTPKYNFKICYFILTLDRDALYDRINKRVDIMIEMGLINEVEQVLNMGYNKNCPGLNTFGYKEIIDFLEGSITKDRAIELIKQNTRRFAKRQITWFKKENKAVFVKKEQALECILDSLK